MLFEPSALFEVAAEAYLRYRQVDSVPGVHYVKPNTLEADLRQIEALKLFFTGVPLCDIRWFHMHAYQEARASGREPFVRYRRPQDAKPKRLKDGTILPPKGKTPCPALPAQVNQEMNMLKRLKIMASCWDEEDKRFFRHLIETHEELPRAFTPEEQYEWTMAARSHPATRHVWLYSLVAFNTLCSPNELRLLRLGDIHLPYQLVRIPWPAAKNPYRHREIAIEDAETLWALEQLLGRAAEMGSKQATDYLFPKRNRKGKPDPTKPMSSSGLKKPWQIVRDITGHRWFRIEDTRHTGATRMAESGKPADLIAARMGHCSPEMRLHYTHISEAAVRNWLRASPGRPPYATAPGWQPPAPVSDSQFASYVAPGKFPVQSVPAAGAFPLADKSPFARPSTEAPPYASWPLRRSSVPAGDGSPSALPWQQGRWRKA